MILASARFLGRLLGVSPRLALKRANALAAIGLLAKVPDPHSRGTRWILAYPDLAEARRRWVLLARAGISERRFSRRFVEAVLGKAVAESVFPYAQAKNKTCGGELHEFQI